MSRQSQLSANDKGESEIIPGAVHGSPGIYLTAEENLRKSLLEDHQMKDEQPVIASKGPLTPNDVSRIAQHVRYGGRKKKVRMGKECLGQYISPARNQQLQLIHWQQWKQCTSTVHGRKTNLNGITDHMERKVAKYG